MQLSRASLTDKEVRALQQRSQRYRVSGDAGLLLEVDPAGGKVWLWRHRYPPTKDGRRQDLQIGPYPRIPLKAARDIRDEQKRLVDEDGINPCDAKKRSKDHRWGKHAPLTFEAVSLDWHATKTAGTWMERHSDDVLKKLNKDIFLAIGGMAIDAIKAQDGLAVPPWIGKWGLLNNKSRLSPTPAHGQGGRQLENMDMHRLEIRLSQGNRYS